MEAPTATIQMHTGANCIASVITYLADFLLGPNYNRILLFGVYLVVLCRGLIKGDSSRSYAVISFTSVVFALLCPARNCFTNFLGFRLFMKHVFTPALGSIDYRPTDKGTILDIVYGPLPLMGYICTFWLTSIVILRKRRLALFDSRHGHHHSTSSIGGLGPPFEFIEQRNGQKGF
jgi:hypothetical protein